MKTYKFVRPGNVLGVGVIVVFGGVPQLSIAWASPQNPERITLADAASLSYQIDDTPASMLQFECNEAGEYRLEKIDGESSPTAGSAEASQSENEKTKTENSRDRKIKK